MRDFISPSMAGTALSWGGTKSISWSASTGVGEGGTGGVAAGAATVIVRDEGGDGAAVTEDRGDTDICMIDEAAVGGGVR